MYALGLSIRRLLATAMSDSPLTPEEYAIYSAIFEDESVSPTRLARRLGMPLTTAMDHVARLEGRGHARRMVDPADRRATLIVLRSAGSAAHRVANRHFEIAYAAFAEALGDHERDATRALRQIRAAVDAAASRQPATRPIS